MLGTHFATVGIGATEKTEGSMGMQFQTWFQAVEGNITSLSRTAGGKADRSSSSHKPRLLKHEGPELAKQVATNLRRAAEYVWACDRSNWGDFHQFAEHVAKLVSKEILPQEISIYRAWVPEGKYQHWPKPHIVESEWLLYCQQFDRQLRAGSMKPHVLAADLERSVDLEIHPFADGCGRTGKLLSSWVLLRAGLLPPLLSDRDAYYKAMNATFVDWISYYEQCMLLRAQG